MMYFRPSVVQLSGSAQAQYEARRAEREVQAARCDIERLFMITEVLWNMLKEQFGYTDEELSERVAEVDMRDGLLDGRVAPSEAPECPECGAKIAKRRNTCIFCGAPVEDDLFRR